MGVYYVFHGHANSFCFFFLVREENLQNTFAVWFTDNADFLPAKNFCGRPSVLILLEVLRMFFLQA